MNNFRKGFKTFAPLILVTILLLLGRKFHMDSIKAIETENSRVEEFSKTTLSRVKTSVITLTEGDTLVELLNGVGNFNLPSQKTSGSIKILSEHLITHFLPKTSVETMPRLDALVPMSVSGDSNGDSLYIVLFQDRGDSAIEKSHARLGGASVVVESITILPKDETIPSEEYKIKVLYYHEGIDEQSGNLKTLPREVVISVTDGHFSDPS